MIYLFAGDDTERKQNAYKKFLETIPKSTESFLMNEDSLDKDQLESLYSGSALFFKKCAVILSGVLEKKEIAEFILKNLEKMVSSENLFIFKEGKQLKPVLETFKKAGADMNIFESMRRQKVEKFNSFVLANALARRDKLNLWINFCRAMKHNVALEELSGILFWKAKDMLIKRDFSKFTESELKNLAGRISYILPEVRKEGRDAETAFEQFLLEVV